MIDTRLRRPYRPGGFTGIIWRLRVRLLLSSLNGALAFLFGLGVQTAFIRFAGAGHFAAYVLQNVFSTQMSFLLARYVTWRDRRVRFFPTLVRYNVQQLSTTLLSIAAFAGLDLLGMYYIAANLTVTLVTAPLSFLIAHNWSIAERQRAPVNPWLTDGMAVAAGRSAK